MSEKTLMLRFSKGTGVLYYAPFTQLISTHGPRAFSHFLTFVLLAQCVMYPLCTTSFYKDKKCLLKHSVQRPNKVLFGQKLRNETVAMTAHFPTLHRRNEAKSALFALFGQKVHCKAIDFLWKKVIPFRPKNERRPMQRPNKKCKMHIYVYFALFKIFFAHFTNEFPSVKCAKKYTTFLVKSAKCAAQRW